MRSLGWVVAAAIAAAAVHGAAPRQAAAQQDEESELLVEEARRALGKKDYARAGRLLDEALAVNPRRIDLYVLRASVHGVQQQHEAAITLLRRALELAPQSTSVKASLGVQLVQAGRADEGVPMLEAIVAAEPRRYDAQVVLGHHYVRAARWPEAMAAFDAYFAHRPSQIAGEDHLHRADHANAVLRAGDPKKARTLYEQVLAKTPRSEIARLGIAWSTAAIDCKRALPLLADLADLEAKYGEVSLVRGRCALLLGKLDEALAAAERYRKAQPKDGAGWALLGDVQAARKNLAAAESSYARALEVAPDDKVYAFKLGRAERLLGKVEEAAARLAKTGAPRYFEDDWTIEYGEALLALDRHEALRAHIAPWAEAHPEHAQGQFFLGVAAYELGDPLVAVRHLELARADEPRARPPLIDALNALAAKAVAAGELASGRALLEQAAEVGDDVLTWRNLGAVLLAQGGADEIARAGELLARAVERDRDDPVALHLLARAHHGGKRYDDARAVYARAVKAYGKDRRAASAYLDLAHAELAAGRGEQAVDAVEAALAGAADAAQKEALGKALVETARHVATDAMRSGRFTVAVRVLKQAEKRAGGAAVVEVRCDLALAATGAGQRDGALDELRRLEKDKARCPFVAPADELAVPILIAWNEGATLRRARKALERLDKLRSKARGVAEPLARLAARDIALRAATEAYADGNLRQAGKFLAQAKAYDKRSPELAHNYAVIQLATGDTDAAIAELERVKGEVPEAYVNLGIAYDRRREPDKALEQWRRAVTAGVRYAPLRDWIEAKERLWGTR